METWPTNPEKQNTSGLLLVFEWCLLVTVSRRGWSQELLTELDALRWFETDVDIVQERKGKCYGLEKKKKQLGKFPNTKPFRITFEMLTLMKKPAKIWQTLIVILVQEGAVITDA
jgi:hypothetical protein